MLRQRDQSLAVLKKGGIRLAHSYYAIYRKLPPPPPLLPASALGKTSPGTLLQSFQNMASSLDFILSRPFLWHETPPLNSAENSSAFRPFFFTNMCSVRIDRDTGHRRFLRLKQKIPSGSCLEGTISHLSVLIEKKKKKKKKTSMTRIPVDWKTISKNGQLWGLKINTPRPPPSPPHPPKPQYSVKGEVLLRHHHRCPNGLHPRVRHPAATLGRFITTRFCHFICCKFHFMWIFFFILYI